MFTERRGIPSELNRKDLEVKYYYYIDDEEIARIFGVCHGKALPELGWTQKCKCRLEICSVLVSVCVRHTVKLVMLTGVIFNVFLKMS